MIELSEMNIGELAAFVCDYLSKNSVECVLSGGACVSIYSSNLYQSGDLDFIELGTYPRRRVVSLMNEIGFIEKNRYFINPETEFFIEFPVGPLSIGSEPVKNVNEMEFSTGMLKLLTPTDCVKDRLAAYYFWDDKQSLEQALLVAKENNIDIKEIRRWSIVENCEKQFNVFQNLLL